MLNFEEFEPTPAASSLTHMMQTAIREKDSNRGDEH